MSLQPLGGEIPDWLVHFKLQDCTCAKCGRTYKTPMQQTSQSTCTPCLEREASERAKLERAALAAECERRTVLSLPVFYRQSRLDNPNITEWVKPASAIQQAKDANIAGAKSIVLAGPSGAGKTTLACALLRAYARRLSLIGTMKSTFDLAKARQQLRLGQGEAPIMLDAMRADIILLNELGKEDIRNQCVEEVIDYRYEHFDPNHFTDTELGSVGPTIYTTPLAEDGEIDDVIDAVANRYGEGVSRRVFEGAAVILLGEHR